MSKATKVTTNKKGCIVFHKIMICNHIVRISRARACTRQVGKGTFNCCNYGLCAVYRMIFAWLRQTLQLKV